MHVVVVDIHVKPEYGDRFIEAISENATSSVGVEPGCFEFTVVRDERDPSHVVLFEVYRDRAAFEEHQKMPHYFKWRDTVANWYAMPNVVTQGKNAVPADSFWSK